MPIGPAVLDEAGPHVINIAHRGASGLAPEHTFAAWDLALAQGADYIEQDLRMTKDGVLVAMHDATVDRTARAEHGLCSGPVATRTLRELKSLDGGSWFNENNPDRARVAYEGSVIPTLDEIFERYGRHTNYYIELKDPHLNAGMAETLLSSMKRHDLIRPAERARRVLIQSFCSETLRAVHAAAPYLPLVQLFAGASSEVISRSVPGAATYAVAIGVAHGDVDEGLMTTAQAHGLQVHPYTVDDVPTMTRLIEMGVAGIFTNFPNHLARALKRRRSFTPA